MRHPYEPVEGVTVVPTAPGNLMQSYVLAGKDPVLVDTGLRWSGRRLAHAVQGIGVKWIALTHAHADHAGSAGWLADLLSVPIRVGPADGERMATGEIDTHRGAAVRAVMRLLAPPPRAPDEPLVEGDDVAGFTVLDAPGHSPGSVAFYRERDRVLIVGDAAANLGRPRSPRVTVGPDALHHRPSLVAHSLRRLADLRPRAVLFGQGPPLADPGFAYEALARACDGGQRT